MKTEFTDGGFPLTVIDNFYDDFDKVFAYASSVSFTENEENYPGKRSKRLHEINPELFDYFCEKLFSVFYETPLTWSVDTSFHLISREDFVKVIHQDNNCLIAGVLYLETGTGGTDIYTVKDGVDNHRLHKYQLESIINKIDIQENHSLFEKSISIEAVKNRCVLYNANQWHAPNFKADKSRLTQPFFVEWIDSTSLPLTRI